MILREQIEREARGFLTRVLAEEAPGALKEVLEPASFHTYITLLTEKCNQLDVYTFQRGYKRWDWADFVRKMAARHARDRLDRIEHRYMQKVRSV